MDATHPNPKYVLLQRNEVLDDSLAPLIVTPNIRSENGEYLKPEAGNIVFKIIPKPAGSFARIDSGLYTTDALLRIVTHPGPDTPSLAELYRPLIGGDEVRFIANTRVFGITTVKGFSDHQRDVPSVNAPVVLRGRLDINARLPRDNALKIPQDWFVCGEDPVEWQEHVRLEAFLLLCPGFRFKILLTKFYDVDAWLSTPAGSRFVHNNMHGMNLRMHNMFDVGICGWVRLGYHFDDRPHKRVVEVGPNGDRFLQKFIFKPGDWHIHLSINHELVSISVRELDKDIAETRIDRVKDALVDPNKRYGHIPWYAGTPLLSPSTISASHTYHPICSVE